jgi:hypothetical protein
MQLLLTINGEMNPDAIIVNLIMNGEKFSMDIP